MNLKGLYTASRRLIRRLIRRRRKSGISIIVRSRRPISTGVPYFDPDPFIPSPDTEEDPDPFIPSPDTEEELLRRTGLLIRRLIRRRRRSGISIIVRSRRPISTGIPYSDADPFIPSPDTEEELLRRTGLLRILVNYVSNASSKHSHIIDSLENLRALPQINGLKDVDKITEYLQGLVSLGHDLRVFFSVPSEPTPSAHQAVALFLNFLHLNVELILRFESDSITRVKGWILNLRTELGFLIAFLGDTTMHLQPARTLLIEIKAVVNEVGNFLYSFFFTVVVFFLIIKKVENNNSACIEDVANEVGSFLSSDFSTFLADILQITEWELSHWEKEDMLKFVKVIKVIKALLHELRSFSDFFLLTGNDQVQHSEMLGLALSALLTKFELLKTKIKEHCVAITKTMMPSHMGPKTAVVSLFIVDSVLHDLMDLVNNKSETTVGANEQILMLHEELMLLGTSIMDTPVEQDTENELMIMQTRDIAYEVEYVICSFSQVWYLKLRLPQLIKTIQLIRKAIQKTKKKINAAGASEGTKQISSQSNKTFVLEDIVVGFEKETTEIIEQLVFGPDQLQIISIVGMPGLGKTTLAKKLYNHPTVVYHFYERGRCVVSQAYTKRTVLIDILMSIGHLSREREAIMKMEDEILAQKLYKSLKGRRYLVVIDDIWDINAWNDLERYFPNDNVGSRILFTSRNKEVGLRASPYSIVNALPLLSEIECWELLQRKVFQDKKCPQELLETGMQIAANCRGLPLTVVVIAGVLANMEKNDSLWQKVEDDLCSNKFIFPDNSLKVLKLSYRHLPMHLKPCFLYFGAFKEDQEIQVDKLISLWVAEGFIKEQKKCLEDVAKKYLMELIDRSLVLVAERRFDGGIKTCKIHDLLREMCLRLAEETSFSKAIKVNEDARSWFFHQVSTYQKHHCLSVDYRADPTYGLYVRSIFCTHCLKPTLMSCSFNVLRVLDFYKSLDDFNAVGIGHAIHLRYLAFSGTLPPMQSFYKLEYLHVDNTRPVEIPDILLNMMKLRHMHFKGGAYYSANHHNQDEIFQTNNNLESISVLSISYRTGEKYLRCSPNLRRLKGRFRSSLSYSFNFLNELESLKLSPDYELFGYIHSSLFSLPLNLKKLTLVDVHVSPEQMEVIGRLPNLVVLKLKRVGFRGGQWDTNEGEFPELKFLKLYNIRLEEWNASGDHFPRLQRLQLQCCLHLKMIPSSFGYISTLEKIEVCGCAQSMRQSAMQIEQEQQDIGNFELQVLISDK